MKSIIFVALALVAIASAAPSEKKPPVEIISFTSETNPDGSYNYSYESADGTSRQESGVLKQTLDADKNPQNVIVVSGSYTFLNSEGKPDTIKYFADETGFHAEGASIPKVE